MDWRGHLLDGYHGRLDDRALPGEVPRRRLLEVVRSEDYVEMLGRDRAA